jgi:hypothetical protein
LNEQEVPIGPKAPQNIPAGERVKSFVPAVPPEWKNAGQTHKEKQASERNPDCEGMA